MLYSSEPKIDNRNSQYKIESVYMCICTSTSITIICVCVHVLYTICVYVDIHILCISIFDKFLNMSQFGSKMVSVCSIGNTS